MNRSRNEIEAEAEKQAADLKEPRAKPIMMALMEYQNGLSVDQCCLICGGPLEIIDHGTIWTVKCPCGKSTSTFYGL
jgi:hypothetical protein